MYRKRKVKYLGGIGAKWTKTRYRSGNKVYSSNAVSTTLLGASVGNVYGEKI